jgi:hypothetical protein
MYLHVLFTMYLTSRPTADAGARRMRWYHQR